MKAHTLVTRIGAGVSNAEGAFEAGVEAARAARPPLAGQVVDLAFLFLSPEHVDRAGEAAQAVREELAPRHLLGCVAEGVVAGARELEEGPSAAVWAASLPGARVSTFHAASVEEDGEVRVEGFLDVGDDDLVVLLADPFTFPVGPFVAGLNAERPGVPLVGGIAAGGRRPGTQALVVDDELYDHGLAGVALGGTRAVTVVSQGCAPIGREAVITHAEGNVIHELAGKPALERLREEVAALSPAERQLVAQGVLVGLVIDENRPMYGRGDFLMRGLIGADESTGALAVGEHVRPGQTVRFHVRDAASAHADLEQALSEALGVGDTAAGALLFTCNGRGTNMFPEPDHDARLVSEALGGENVAGFFCGGEIGPVGGHAFLHGFTATLAVFLAD